MSKLGTRVFTVGSWLTFLVAWCSLLVRLLLHWSGMSVDLHLDLLLLLLFFGALWEELVRKKSDVFNLFMASFALVAVVDLVNRVT